VTGREGQLARAIRELLPAAGWHVEAIGRPEVDLERPGTVADAIRRARPAVVVSAAAYTAVDRAEDEPERAAAVNAVAPGVVAAAAAEVGAPVIHVSTDYVFDGSKRSPYSEADATKPLGVYGATKLAGEVAVAAANPRHVILRTAWVASPVGTNFVRTMLRLAAERPALRVVADQRGAPTFAADLASAVRAVADRLIANPPPGPEHYGIFHIASAGETSWHGFAEAIVDGAARRGVARVPVEAITTAEFPTRARRPAYSKLSSDRIASVYGIRLPHWRDGLERCLDTLIGPPIPNTPDPHPQAQS
jgi:dTDP-4-dehydrorhamnose reductase